MALGVGKYGTWAKNGLSQAARKKVKERMKSIRFVVKIFKVK
jgi:hypothetical protein